MELDINEHLITWLGCSMETKFAQLFFVIKYQWSFLLYIIIFLHKAWNQ
jgi:hypothetical protein